MSCEFDRVALYHSGELEAAELADFQSHLSSCNECRDYLESLRVVTGRLSRLAEIAPRADLVGDALRKIDRQLVRRANNLKKLAWVASIATVMTTGLYLVMQRPGEVTESETAVITDVVTDADLEFGITSLRTRIRMLKNNPTEKYRTNFMMMRRSVRSDLGDRLDNLRRRTNSLRNQWISVDT